MQVHQTQTKTQVHWHEQILRTPGALNALLAASLRGFQAEPEVTSHPACAERMQRSKSRYAVSSQHPAYVQTVLERKYLPCMHLAHHEPGSTNSDDKICLYSCANDNIYCDIVITVVTTMVVFFY